MAYHRRTRGRVLGAVSGFVAVTHERAGRFTQFEKPIEGIANGVDLGEFFAGTQAPAGPHRLIVIGNTGRPGQGT